MGTCGAHVWHIEKPDSMSATGGGTYATSVTLSSLSSNLISQVNERFGNRTNLFGIFVFFLVCSTIVSIDFGKFVDGWEILSATMATHELSRCESQTEHDVEFNAKTDGDDLDLVFKEVGEFNPYQIWKFVLLFIPIVLSAVYAINFIVTASNLDYRWVVICCIRSGGGNSGDCADRHGPLRLR